MFNSRQTITMLPSLEQLVQPHQFSMPRPTPEYDDSLQELTRSSDVPILVTQGDSIVLCNDPAATLLGFERSELLNLKSLKLFHPDEHHAIIERVQKFLGGQSLSPAYPTRLLTKEGAVLTVQMIGLPNYWHGKPAFLNFIHDKTREWQLDQQIQNLRRLQSVATLAAGVAHDFNNILMVIRGTVALMKDETGVEGNRDENLELIEQQLDSATTITSQLLRQARRKIQEPTCVHLPTLINATSRSFAPTRENISIRQDVDYETANVHCDRSELEQVILNLLGNAADAMPGGGTIKIRLRKLNAQPGQHHLADGNDYAHLTIKDSGSGMEQKVLDRIFEPFFTTKDIGRGTGLGLYCVHQVIHGLKGEVRVASTPGAGTNFDIYLPVIPPSPVPELAVPLSGPSKDVVLLVDDEQALLNITAKYLSRRGYNTLTAAGGQEALELFSSRYKEVDVLVIDLNMPMMGGIELFRRVRRIDSNANVIIASGNELPEGISGIAAVLRKPYDLTDLTAQIQRVLEIKRPATLINRYASKTRR